MFLFWFQLTIFTHILFLNFVKINGCHIIEQISWTPNQEDEETKVVRNLCGRAVLVRSTIAHFIAKTADFAAVVPLIRNCWHQETYILKLPKRQRRVPFYLSKSWIIPVGTLSIYQRLSLRIFTECSVLIYNARLNWAGCHDILFASKKTIREHFEIFCFEKCYQKIFTTQWVYRDKRFSFFYELK